MKRLSRALILAVVVFAIAALAGNPTAPAAAQAQTGSDPLYFEETGYSVGGKFLEFFQSAKEPLEIFGYPISNEINDTASANTVQYFQRARMELTAAGEVELTPLGSLLHDDRGTSEPVATNRMACRMFAQTGYSVCYAFLHFYDENNGSVFFGNPISDIELLDGRYVQYFDRVRMEWRPEMPAGERLVLADLGRVYYDQVVGVTYDATRNTGSANSDPVKLRVNAFVSNALISANSTQTLYVVVQDQNYQPVEDAMVKISAYFPDGSRYDVRTPATDVNGVSVHSFMVKDMPVKEVVRVDVTVEYQGAQSTASTWFRIWY
jgi:hypothetical protein